MKARMILGLLLVCSYMPLNAMENDKVNKLTFSVAQKGEDLDAYKVIMLKVYLNYVENPDQKEKIKQWLERCFGILTSWIGEEGKVFVKAQAGETPVGYSTMEVLDDEQTRIALHQSPLLPEYMPQLPEGIAYMKTLFPNAKAAYTSASTKKLQEFVKQVGFKEDDSYVPNKELLPDPKGYIGFRKDFGDTK